MPRLLVVRCHSVKNVLLFVLIVLADDETRVILPKLDGDPSSDYINANFLDVR